MSLESNLAAMEKTREAYWLAYPGTSPIKLRWRALNVRHAFHVLPGESILEIGAGSGLWTSHLSSVLRGQNPITAAYFNDEFASRQGKIPNARFVKVNDLDRDLPAESFDYIVGTTILCHDAYDYNLRALRRLLKPGGQILFFEPNFWNPQVAVKNSVSWIGRKAGHADCQIGMRKWELMKIASQQGFTEIDIRPYDIIHPLIPRAMVHAVQSSAFVMEHAPLLRELCGTLSIWARKPGNNESRRPVNLAEHAALADSVSFVIPCHNEEMNVPRIVEALTGFYGPYVHEIIIVNDNSTDRTAEVTRAIAATDSRVKLVDRKPPNGVGRALRDGYAAATGRYILTMDSDFVHIVPEFRDLFDAIVEGYDGAIGSRFTHESLMVNYPFLKILCNRGFHLLANFLVPRHFRDISNNLKLYRADILKQIEIEQPHFAANVETGLKPILAGYSIKEVPISWINRTIDMGASTFVIAKVAPNYFGALVKIVSHTMFRRKEVPREAEGA